MKHYGNVTKINGAEVEPVDIITFGSPCQDLSVAGKRAGIQDGERSNLFFEAVRIIKEMRDATNNEYPKYAVWENVPGAFSSNKGHDFHAVLEALCSVCDDTVSIPKPYNAKRANQLVWSGAGEIVGDNYSVAWRTLDAQYWGVPQRRKRIYLVADFTGRRAREILFKPDSLRRDMQEGNEKGQGATADAVGSADGSVGVIDVIGLDCYNQSITGYVSKSLNSAATDSDHVPCIIMSTTLKERTNCEGGKNNQQSVVFSFDSLSSNSMKSSNPFSGCRAVEVAKCIDTTYPDPSKNQGGVAVVECIGYDMYNQSSTGDKTRTLKTPAGGDDLPVIFLNNQGGSSINIESEEISPTLRANSHQHEPVIAFAQNQREEVRDLGDKAGALGKNTGFGAGADGETACTITGDHQNRMHDQQAVLFEPRSPDGEPRIYSDICPTLNTAQGGQRQPCIATPSKPPRKYIVRRLTTTECARLQGFPDWWSTLAPYNPADAEFWEDVRKTHAEINGKKYKPTKNLKKWYEGLHTDSAEYKMWGNGIALPNARYVMQGIAEQGTKTLGSLFDGSGGFPLAGVLNGIKPVWASEIEPYPIAVTKSRFGED